MIITDGMRLKLAEKAREVFDEEGDLLMQHLPVGGANNLATKNDLEKTKLEIMSHVSHESLVAVGAGSAVVAALLAIFGLVVAFVR